MARGMVVAYYGELGGRLTAHQKTMLEANAEAIARLKGSAFGGAYEDARDYSAPLYFVPDDTLLVAESKSLGIQDEQDLFGGVVPRPFVKTKSITHRLVDESAERPDGWTPRFTERVHDVVLPGYTVFSTCDARVAAKRLTPDGPIRLKRALACGSRAQVLIATADQARNDDR